MTKSPKKHIRGLERRKAFLESQINTPGAYSEKARTYRQAEFSALRWAIPLLCEQAGVKQVVYPVAVRVAS